MYSSFPIRGRSSLVSHLLCSRSKTMSSAMLSPHFTSHPSPLSTLSTNCIELIFPGTTPYPYPLSLIPCPHPSLFTPHYSPFSLPPNCFELFFYGSILEDLALSRQVEDLPFSRQTEDLPFGTMACRSTTCGLSVWRSTTCGRRPPTCLGKQQAQAA